MRAFRNDPAVKEAYLTALRVTRAAGLSCAMIGSKHAIYERDFEIPYLLVELVDSIGDVLPHPDNAAWWEPFVDAIPVGSDLSLVWPQFVEHLLCDETYGVVRWVQAPRYAQQKRAVDAVTAYYQAWIGTGAQPDVAGAYAAFDAAHTAAYGVYAVAHPVADTAALAEEATRYNTVYHAVYHAGLAAAYATFAAAYALFAAVDASVSHAVGDAVAVHAAAYAAGASAPRIEARRWQARLLLDLVRQAPVHRDGDTEDL